MTILIASVLLSSFNFFFFRLDVYPPFLTGTEPFPLNKPGEQWAGARAFLGTIVHSYAS